MLGSLGHILMLGPRYGLESNSRLSGLNIISES